MMKGRPGTRTCPVSSIYPRKLFFTGATRQGCSMKSDLKKCHKMYRKTPVLECLFLRNSDTGVFH